MSSYKVCSQIQRFVRLALLVTTLGLTQNLCAQEYPQKSIRVIVPWPAGGFVDVAARLAAEQLTSTLGQALVIENKPGAGGMIGADMVAKAPGDGYTLLFTTSALTMNAALRSKMPFDLKTDLIPIAIEAYSPSVIVVHPMLGVKTLQELIALAKQQPGKLTYASAGNGTPAHLIAELFKANTAVDIVHVPYKGGPPAMIDQIAGRVDVQVSNAMGALQQVKDGKLLALAVTSPERFEQLPEVPTMAQAGVANFETDQWLGFFAPRGISAAILRRLSGDINQALATATLRDALKSKGMRAATASTPNAFRDYLDADLQRWTALVKRLNISAE
jgi:tripartite-type tricarboxylate transporter receptor subunit TctC